MCHVHKFSSGYAILAPGYKFRGWQFEKPGYTRTVGGQRGLWHACNVRPRPHPQEDKNIYKYFYEYFLHASKTF